MSASGSFIVGRDCSLVIICWPIAVPVPSDTSWGASMMDEYPIPDLKKLARPLRLQLRNEYLGGYAPSFERTSA